MRPFSELRQMATTLRRNARQPDVIELCDAMLELTATRQTKAELVAPKPRAVKSGECPSCSARREAKRVAQAKWRSKGK